LPFLWFCCEKGVGNKVVAFFLSGGVVKKALTIGGFFLFFFLSGLFGLIH
jgi:hypothetical protein